MHADSRTGQLLHEDHHRVIDLLNALDRFLALAGEAEPPACDGPDARKLLTALSAELGRELERHFALEEALFPRIAAAGAYELTADLDADHQTLLPLARRLARLCDLALREGFDEETWPVFRYFGRELVDGLVLHIQKEEGSLLAAVDEVLTPEQDAQFADAQASA